MSCLWVSENLWGLSAIFRTSCVLCGVCHQNRWPCPTPFPAISSREERPTGGRDGPVLLTAILRGCFPGGLPLALCPSPLRLGHLAHLQTSVSSPEEVFTLSWASKPPGTGFNTALEAHSHQLTFIRTGGTQVSALPTDHPDASFPPHPATHI